MDQDLSVFSSPDFKEYIQFITDMLSHDRLAFLIGAGCSKIAGLPIMEQLTKDVLNDKTLSEKTRLFLGNIQSQFLGADSATIEDYLSEIVDLISIADRRKQCGAELQKITVGDLEAEVNDLQVALNEIKKVISSIIQKIEKDVTTHQHFIRAIHGTLRSGKEDRKVDYFVLNYDTLIEDALGLEKIEYIDGFIGATTGWWDAGTFKNFDNKTRVFKMHGSIDWCLLKGESVPRRIRSGLKTEIGENHVMIYPAATKYQEVQHDPYAQMLKCMRKVLCPPIRKELILVICGYGFGDSHINLEIENALLSSEKRLTIIVFISSDEPSGKLGEWLSNPLISEQIIVFSNKRFIHGRKREFPFHKEILWWKFETLTKIIGGFR